MTAHPAGHLRARARHNGSRAWSTLRDFDNGPRLLVGLLTGRPDDLHFRVDGLDVKCPNVAGARVPVYEVFVDDSYRTEWTFSGLGASPVVLDLGAHLGCYALDVVRHRPGATVHAFEASPSTAEYLQRNIDANDLTGRVIAHDVAVMSRAGTLAMADEGVGSCHTGILLMDDDSATIEVPAVSLAQAFAMAGSVDVVKLDVEGAEYDMILNSPVDLWLGVERVVMEYHPLEGASWDALEAHFAEAGLTLTHRIPVKPGLGQAWLSRAPMSPFPG